jgi:hypothetical protein
MDRTTQKSIPTMTLAPLTAGIKAKTIDEELPPLVLLLDWPLAPTGGLGVLLGVSAQ